MNYHIYTNSSLFILTRKELLKWIFDEKCHPETCIQKGFEGQWQKACDTSEWRLFYDDNTNKDWVILIKRDGGDRSFKQKGMYSTEQVRFFLKEGLCSPKDFIWKKGFREWRRISLVLKFSTHPMHTIEDILAWQMRKYKLQKPKIIRYSPSAPSSILDWGDLKPKGFNCTHL
ncbi:MAG: hypothetical protein OXM55_06325 [Bdellovibrionales bacterium]|nr:hypothetical protein [Bdellovibrionales bacterium]